MIKIISIDIKPYTGSMSKRYTATIKYVDSTKEKQKTINFGQSASNTYFDGAEDYVRKAYIARHSKSGENWNDPLTAGYWARWFLWEVRKSQVTSFIKSKIPNAKINIML
jgi:hypothetical protein